MSKLDVNSIKKSNSDFSFVKQFIELINNIDYKKSADEWNLLSGQPDNSRTYFWSALSAIADNVGAEIYQNTLNYIDNVNNIDVCTIQALQSLLSMLGVKYTIFNDIDKIPQELLELLNVLSIKRDLLLSDKKVSKQVLDYISTHSTTSVDYDEELLRELNEAQKQAGISSEIVLQPYIDSDKFEAFLSAIYYDIIESNINKRYSDTDTLIWEDLSDSIMLSGFIIPHNQVCANYISTLKTKYGIPQTFDEVTIADDIYIGNDLIENYSVYEQSVLSSELESRKCPHNNLYSDSKYVYYEQKAVKDYFQFIEYEYNNLSSSYLTAKKYDLNTNYIELSGGDNYSTLLYYNGVESRPTLNENMIKSVISLLINLTQQIEFIRSDIKTLVQKNFLRGTNLLLSFFIKDYIVTSTYQTIKKIKPHLDISEEKYSPIIKLIEYIDTTEYFNLSTEYDTNISTLNQPYWLNSANQTSYNDSNDSTNIYVKTPVIDSTQSIITEDDISTFYLNILDVKFNSYNSLTQTQLLSAFLSAVFASAADNSYKSDTDKRFVYKELYTAQLSAKQIEINDKNTTLDNIENIEIEYNLSSTYDKLNVEGEEIGHDYYKLSCDILDLVDTIQSKYENNKEFTENAAGNYIKINLTSHNPEILCANVEKESYDVIEDQDSTTTLYCKFGDTSTDHPLLSYNENLISFLVTNEDIIDETYIAYEKYYEPLNPTHVYNFDYTTKYANILEVVEAPDSYTLDNAIQLITNNIYNTNINKQYCFVNVNDDYYKIIDIKKYNIDTSHTIFGSDQNLIFITYSTTTSSHTCSIICNDNTWKQLLAPLLYIYKSRFLKDYSVSTEVIKKSNLTTLYGRKTRPQKTSDSKQFTQLTTYLENFDIYTLKNAFNNQSLSVYDNIDQTIQTNSVLSTLLSKPIYTYYATNNSSHTTFKYTNQTVVLDIEQTEKLIVDQTNKIDLYESLSANNTLSDDLYYLDNDIFCKITDIKNIDCDNNKLTIIYYVNEASNNTIITTLDNIYVFNQTYELVEGNGTYYKIGTNNIYQCTQIKQGLNTGRLQTGSYITDNNGTYIKFGKYQTSYSTISYNNIERLLQLNESTCYYKDENDNYIEIDNSKRYDVGEYQTETSKSLNNKLTTAITNIINNKNIFTTSSYDKKLVRWYAYTGKLGIWLIAAEYQASCKLNMFIEEDITTYYQNNNSRIYFNTSYNSSNKLESYDVSDVYIKLQIYKNAGYLENGEAYLIPSVVYISFYILENENTEHIINLYTNSNNKIITKYQSNNIEAPTPGEIGASITGHYVNREAWCIYYDTSKQVRYLLEKDGYPASFSNIKGYIKKFIQELIDKKYIWLSEIFKPEFESTVYTQDQKGYFLLNNGSYCELNVDNTYQQTITEHQITSDYYLDTKNETKYKLNNSENLLDVSNICYSLKYYDYQYDYANVIGTQNEYVSLRLYGSNVQTYKTNIANIIDGQTELSALEAIRVKDTAIETEYSEIELTFTPSIESDLLENQIKLLEAINDSTNVKKECKDEQTAELDSLNVDKEEIEKNIETVNSWIDEYPTPIYIHTYLPSVDVDGKSIMLNTYDLLPHQFLSDELYQHKVELFNRYTALSTSDIPYYYYKNLNHPSYQIHPYFNGFIEKNNAVDSYPIDNNYLQQVVSAYDAGFLTSNISTFITEFGFLSNVWKNDNRTNVDYTTYYDESDHLNDQSQQHPVCGYEGIFYPESVNDFLTDKTSFLTSLSAENNENYWYDGNYLSHASRKNIVELLTQFEREIRSVFKEKYYDIYKYAIDTYGNQYFLLKTYNSGSTLNDVLSASTKLKDSTCGTLWVKIKNQPIAFPIIAKYGRTIVNTQISFDTVTKNGLNDCSYHSAMTEQYSFPDIIDFTISKDKSTLFILAKVDENNKKVIIVSIADGTAETVSWKQSSIASTFNIYNDYQFNHFLTYDENPCIIQTKVEDYMLSLNVQDIVENSINEYDKTITLSYKPYNGEVNVDLIDDDNHQLDIAYLIEDFTAPITNYVGLSAYKSELSTTVSGRLVSIESMYLHDNYAEKVHDQRLYSLHNDLGYIPLYVSSDVSAISQIANTKILDYCKNIGFVAFQLMNEPNQNGIDFKFMFPARIYENSTANALDFNGNTFIPLSSAEYLESQTLKEIDLEDTCIYDPYELAEILQKNKVIQNGNIQMRVDESYFNDLPDEVKNNVKYDPLVPYAWLIYQAKEEYKQGKSCHLSTQVNITSQCVFDLYSGDESDQISVSWCKKPHIDGKSVKNDYIKLDFNAALYNNPPKANNQYNYSHAFLNLDRPGFAGYLKTYKNVGSAYMETGRTYYIKNMSTSTVPRFFISSDALITPADTNDYTFIETDTTESTLSAVLVSDSDFRIYISLDKAQ